MSVDAHVPRRSTKTLPFSVRDMLFGLGVAVLLCHSEINHVYRLKAVSEDRTALCGDPLLAPLEPGRPMRKLSGLISR